MNRASFKYAAIMVAVLALRAAQAWADDAPAAPVPPPGVENEVRQLRAQLDSIRELIDFIDLKPSADIEGEILRARAGIDSARALLKFYGVKPYAYRMILRPSLVYDKFIYHSRNDNTPLWSPGLLLDTKFTFKLSGKYSPYVGASAGALLFGGWLGASAGVERAYVYGNGFSVTWSYGAYAGGILDEDAVATSAGIQTAACIAFNHRRVSQYIIAGARLNAYRVIYFALPVGLGLAIKL
jgi:hypothetical protein